MSIANDNPSVVDPVAYSKEILAIVDKEGQDRWIQFPTNMLRSLVQGCDDWMEFAQQDEETKDRFVEWIKDKYKAKVYEFPR